MEDDWQSVVELFEHIVPDEDRGLAVALVGPVKVKATKKQRMDDTHELLRSVG